MRLYATLRSAADGGRLDLAGTYDTIGEVLDELVERFPDLRPLLFVGDQAVRQLVAIMVDGRDIRHLAGLATPLPEGCAIDIFPPVAGGADVERRVAIRGLSEWLLRDYLADLGAQPDRDAPEAPLMNCASWRVSWTQAPARIPGSVLVLTEFTVVLTGDEQIVTTVESQLLRKAQRGGG